MFQIVSFSFNTFSKSLAKYSNNGHAGFYCNSRPRLASMPFRLYPPWIILFPKMGSSHRVVHWLKFGKFRGQAPILQNAENNFSLTTLVLLFYSSAEAWIAHSLFQSMETRKLAASFQKVALCKFCSSDLLLCLLEQLAIILAVLQQLDSEHFFVGEENFDRQWPAEVFGESL